MGTIIIWAALTAMAGNHKSGHVLRRHARILTFDLILTPTPTPSITRTRTITLIQTKP